VFLLARLAGIAWLGYQAVTSPVPFDEVPPSDEWDEAGLDAWPVGRA
jgi:hypothetical protein